MFMFTYWDNSKEWHGAKVFECKAENITQADALFKETTGYDPNKFGCAIVKITNEP